MNWVTLHYQVKFSIQSFKPLEDVFESALRSESPKRDTSSRNSSLKCSDQRFSFFYSIKSDFCDRYNAHLMQTVARQRCVNAFISSAIIILGLREMDEKSVIHPTEYINHSKIFYLPFNFGIPVHQIQYLCTVLRFIDFSSLLLCKTRRHKILTSPASDSMLQ